MGFQCSFQLPRVYRCCCLSLRTGVLIIGYLSLASTLIGVASSAALIVAINKYVKEHENKPPADHTPEQIRTSAIYLYIQNALHMVLYTVHFVISLLLVLGVHKSKPELMRYYFFAGSINLILNLILTVYVFIFTGFITTVIMLLVCLVMFYFLVVVRSLMLTMEEEKNPVQLPVAQEMQLMQAMVKNQEQPLMAQVVQNQNMEP